jgi:enoyl-[acyl-carrier-protein] reductase (NADH)
MPISSPTGADAGAAASLASDASDSVTGQLLIVDAGATFV